MSQILALLVQLQDVGVRVHIMDIGVVDISSVCQMIIFMFLAILQGPRSCQTASRLSRGTLTPARYDATELLLRDHISTYVARMTGIPRSMRVPRCGAANSRQTIKI